jgi:uncharacterized integral membrane protein
MRWVYLPVIILFVAAVVRFAIQNLQLTTMSFLGFSLRARLAVLAVVNDLLGAFTGGSLVAPLRATIQATKASWPAPSRT